jgi:hypothetical protein
VVNDPNGWSEYEKLVMFRLDQQEKKIDDLTNHVVSLRIRSSLWGAVSGAITGLMAALVGSTQHK